MIHRTHNEGVSRKSAPGHRAGQRLLALCVGAIALVLSAAPGLAAFLPPDLDYAKLCPAATKAAVALDRDWTAWSGEPVTIPPRDLLAIANEYVRGSERLLQSVATGQRILKYLEDSKALDQAGLDRAIGRALIAGAASADDFKAGEARLLSALGAGEAGAALDLAQYYARTAPPSLRDPQKARQYAQSAAAGGDPDAKLLFARILTADPNVQPAEKEFATETAMLGLIQAVTEGECHYLATVASMYLRGDLVPQDGDTAAAWFEQAAETGDARVLERLADLLTSSLVTAGDFNRAMDFREAAANKGRPAAAMLVAKAYISGVLRPRDLAAGQKYLEIAAKAGTRDAQVWLAHMFRGDFGSTPDLARARTAFEAALAIGPFDAGLAAEYGSFLLLPPVAPADAQQARALLIQAAQAGSGDAAATIGNMLLNEARANPALYAQAETYLRLAAGLGRSDSARELSELYLCGGDRFSPARSKQWQDRAAALGSGSEMLATGIAQLGASDPAAQQSGAALIKQAALRDDARALAYWIVQLERGGTAFGQDAELAARLRAKAETSPDPEFRHDVAFALVRVQLGLPDADTDALVAQLDELAAGGDIDAAMLKADVLKDRGAEPTELAPIYEAGSAAGIRKAMREYGMLQLADPSIDVSVARGWLQKAAAAGDVKAMLRLIDTTAVDAVAQLQGVAASGTVCTVDDMVSLAEAYSTTIDASASTYAAKWLETATVVAGDQPDDLVKIANAYRKGIAGAALVANAEQFLARAAQLGAPQAARALADGHLRGLWADASVETGQKLLAGLAIKGDAEAATRLLRAVADHELQATAEDVAALVDANADNLTSSSAGSALFKLARMDEQNGFGDLHPELRLRWLELAANAGEDGAMLHLYRAYASGIGVDASPDLAFQWLLKAADTGNPRAAKELAAAYATGFGVAVNTERAAFWRAQSELSNGG